MPSNIPGYLRPTSSQPLPGGLSLEDFIQTVIVGVSGITGTLVRPKWQQNPPKQPDVDVDWVAFGVQQVPIDANAYVGMQPDDSTLLARMEKLEIQLSFYGPNAQENAATFRDGFQIQQNLEALYLANMGFNGISPAIRGPDLINQRWVNRFEVTLTLVRTIIRTYPVLSFASAGGSIHTVVADDDLTLEWETEEPTP